MWYDLVVLAVLAYATVRGAIKGIVWQLAVIASLVLCFAFSESLSAVIAPYIGLKAPLNRWIAMFVLYIVFAFISFGIARQLREWIEKAKFVELDRHLGAVFGFIKGAIFALVLTFFAVTLSESAPGLRATVFESYSGKAAAIIMDRLHPVMPDELHDVLEPYIHRLDRPELDLRHAHDRDPSGSADRAHNHTHHSHGPVSRPNDLNDDWHGNPGGDAKPHIPADDGFAPWGRGFFGWLDGKDGDDADPGARDPLPGPGGQTDDDRALRRRRDELVQELATVLSDVPTTQAAFIDDIAGRLSGVPDRLAVLALDDWHADLVRFDPETDPDPETDYATPLETRIVRQLERAGVSRTSLDDELRSRLDRVRR
ncbi:MAG: CvpA family protein [Planctomycetes bacterium]|nr:CvpA family protein [Planctomycetota bacterium]